jgi:hypothetical protein
MKTIIRLAVILSFITILSNQKAAAQEVTLDYFYDQLAPYGHWERIDPYGWTWQPYNVAPEWRPYTDGYWINTDYGWTYQADNDWSWAAYHYGRWNFNETVGWFWIPGTVWGPAWVAWRHNDQYIGWAPLPYEAEWHEDGGFRSSGFNIEVGIGWSRWSFVATQHFGDPGIHLYIENSARNVTYLNRTRNITNYTVVNHQIYNNVINVAEIERTSHRRIEHYNIVESRSQRDVGISRANPQQYHVYRPSVAPRRQADPPQQNARSSSEPAEQVYQRHEQENRQYNERSNQRYNDLLEAQRREEASHARKKVIQQHNTELRAFNEQRTVETKVLQNRQQQETKPQQQTPQNNARPQQQQSQQQPQQQSQTQTPQSRDNKTSTPATQKSEPTSRQSQTEQPAATNQTGNRR